MNIRTYLDHIVFYLVLQVSAMVLAENAKEVNQVSASLDQFAFKFLAETSQQAGSSLNLALSPYTIWSLMVIISEGARENTAFELEKTLGIPSLQKRDDFRKLYTSFAEKLKKINEPGVTLDITNSIYTATGQQLKPTFSQIAQSVYNVEVSPINFGDTKTAANTINKQIFSATRGRISDFVQPDDLTFAQVFLASTLYFKGLWDEPFNESATTKDDFFDENGNKIGEVKMMFNSGPYPYSLILGNNATAVELPYKGKSMSMILILPKKNLSLQSLLKMLAESPFSSITAALDQAVEYFGDEPVRVYMPKFKIVSDLNLNYVLDRMGIKDILIAERANLLGMFDNNLYVSRVLQRAEISVDEEGTVASSASGAAFEYKSPPPRFVANKPFVYLIYDKESKSILFIGKVSNPQQL